MADVKLRDIRKTFGSTEVIKGVDLDINDQDFVVFVGPSGCGKSTLLRLIAGLEDITSGSMTIDDKEVSNLPPKHRDIAMVFQSYALYPHMSVRENMAFGLKLAKHDVDDIETRVKRAADILQLQNLLDRKPKELSGGQRQRVAIGRAITRDPKVFLMDEPLSNLDAALRVQTRIEIAKLKQDLKATMVYVTHDQVEAMTLANKIVVLNAGEIEQVGSPLELYHHPRNLFVAGFIGSPAMNFLSVQIDQADANGVAVTLPKDKPITCPVLAQGVKRGDHATFGIRPEHIDENGQGDTVLEGEVFVVERLGSATYAHITLWNGETLVVQTDGNADVQPGQQLKAGIPAHETHIFTENGTALERMYRNQLADAQAAGAR